MRHEVDEVFNAQLLGACQRLVSLLRWPCFLLVLLVLFLDLPLPLHVTRTRRTEVLKAFHLLSLHAVLSSPLFLLFLLLLAHSFS